MRVHVLLSSKARKSNSIIATGKFKKFYKKHNFFEKNQLISRETFFKVSIKFQKENLFRRSNKIFENVDLIDFKNFIKNFILIK